MDTQKLKTPELSDVQKTILHLRLITELTGALHEVQVKNLFAWFQIAAPHVTSFDLGFDPEKKEVVYLVKEQKDEQKDELQAKRYEALGEWVKQLLGDQYVVRIECAGERSNTCDPTENEESREFAPASYVDLSTSRRAANGKRRRRKSNSN